jgi:hypothetical protein
MVRAINLNQFAETVATIAGLVNPGCTGMRTPEPSAVIQLRMVSTERYMMAFLQFSVASVGPKSE